METDIAQATSSNMKSGVPNYSVPMKTIDEAGVQPETYWINPYWHTYLGYLKTIPEYRNAITSFSRWVCGKGWTCPLDEHTVLLENLRGWGEDTFDSIMQDMIVVKKTNGDSYAETIRNDKGTLVNLKKLNPYSVRHVVDPKGILLGYDVMQSDGKYKRFRVDQIFHLCNDRIANEIHGISVLESCKWLIDWKNEMLSDLRRVMHRSTIRVIYIEVDNASKLTTVKTEYASAIKNGELMLLPAKKGEAEFQDLNIPPTQAWMDVIRYTDNYFYEILGVPKIITGGTQDYTEASSKIGYLSFEVPYSVEARLLEQDIWNQLGIRIEFEKPVSLKENVQEDESANTGQASIQPNEMMATMARNE